MQRSSKKGIGMKNKRRKLQLKIRRVLRETNKSLKEDLFAGRFEVKLVNRKDFAEPAYHPVYCPKNFTINEAGDPQWNWSLYTIELIDNEEPERNCQFAFRWSETFELCDGHPLDDKAYAYYRSGGLFKLNEAINDFIIYSDFWKKWNYLEYARTHWFSGKALDKQMEELGPEWIDADTLLKARPDKFKLGPVPERFEEEE